LTQIFFRTLYKAIFKTIDHDGVEHAGYMSFMVLFSLFPFLVFFFAFTSFIGASELGQKLIELLIEHLPQDATAAIAPRILEIVQTPPEQLMTLAIIGAIWTSSSFVEGLRTILNRIYEVATPPTYLWRRFLSIIQFLSISIGVTLILFLLIIIPAGLSKIPAYVAIVSKLHPVWSIARYFAILFFSFLTVCYLYYILPNINGLKFREVIPGAIITVILWSLSGAILSKYLIYYTKLSLIYGSIGGIIATLLFFFVINMLFIYGAEFNYLYNKHSR
jgi:membrane protein